MQHQDEIEDDNIDDSPIVNSEDLLSDPTFKRRSSTRLNVAGSSEGSKPKECEKKEERSKKFIRKKPHPILEDNSRSPKT